MSELTDKDKLDFLEALRRGAYDSFNDRRSYELKLSLSVWTALAVLIAGLVQPAEAQETFPFHGHRYGIIGCLVGFIIIVMHLYFNIGIARANAIDRLKEKMLSDVIKSKLNVEKEIQDHPDRDRLNSLVASLPVSSSSGKMQWRNWAHIAELMFTTLLTAIAVTLFWIRAT